jgi:hypothetical protein
VWSPPEDVPHIADPKMEAPCRPADNAVQR